MANKPQKKGVRWAYTFPELKRAIESLHREKSLREIGKSLGVSHAVIQRILQGIEPKTFYIRNRLLLPNTAPAPVCPRPGVVHVSHRCPADNSKPRPKRRNWRGLCLTLAGLVANRR